MRKARKGRKGSLSPFASEKNPEALAKAIGRILDDEALYNRLSKNANEEIKKWTYERQAKGFLDAVEYSLREKQE